MRGLDPTSSLASVLQTWRAVGLWIRLFAGKRLFNRQWLLDKMCSPFSLMSENESRKVLRLPKSCHGRVPVWKSCFSPSLSRAKTDTSICLSWKPASPPWRLQTSGPMSSTALRYLTNCLLSDMAFFPGLVVIYCLCSCNSKVRERSTEQGRIRSALPNAPWNSRTALSS